MTTRMSYSGMNSKTGPAADPQLRDTAPETRRARGRRARNDAAGGTGDVDGSAVTEMIIELMQAFFRLRAAGRSMGAVTPSGRGLWGFLRTLARQGPRTVPEIARQRPVSRQRIQRLADDAAADGLVEFVPNPRHKRSRLVRLTAKGERAFADMSDRISAWAGDVAPDLDPRDVAAATRVLRQLRAHLDARQPSREPTAERKDDAT
jgi:DNA-binding MarR family transcriptional regulator